jgi:hypothetical protein
MRVRRVVLKEVAKLYPEFEAIAGFVFTLMGYSWLAKLLGLLIPLQIFSIGVFVVLTLVWPWTIVFFWEQVLTIVANPVFRTIAVILLVISGFLLYLARTYMRPFYGVAEVFIGIATCWSGLSYPNPSAKILSASLAVVGGIYIIIRGFDNIIDDKSLTDPFMQPVEAGERGG